MELLAPAGNYESLKAAVLCGADAVYLGLEKYGARAGAHNFDSEALRRAVTFAHLHGVKIYVTVNTLLKDEETPGAVQAVAEARAIGADAFIVQDAGLIVELRNRMPDVVLHGSTQMGICNAYGAQYAQSLGITRIVAARETLPQDIREIKNTCSVEVEVFCQGALCVSYSGNCYYSSLVSGCSGNRGRCLQLCRKKYTVGKQEGYFLSAKDICLLDKVAELKKIGVDALKIEGRMRTPEYVAETVSVYRGAIDGKTVPHAMDRLKKVFNRGDYCSAYFVQPTEPVIYPKVQNHIGIGVGRVASIRNGKATLHTGSNVSHPGDGVKYLRNGYEVGGGQIDGMQTGYQGRIRIGDEVRLTAQAALKERLATMDERIETAAYLRIAKDTGAVLTLSARNVSVTVNGETDVIDAQHTPVCADDAKQAIGTLGGTEFTLTAASIEIEEHVFYPMSHIKTLRKQAVEQLKTEILNEYDRHRLSAGKSETIALQWFSPKDNAIWVQIPSADALHKLKFAYDYVILAPDSYADYAELHRQCTALHGNAFLQLPVILRGKDIEYMKKLRDLPVAGYIVNNVSEYMLFRDKPILDGLGANRLNQKKGGTFIDSVEADSAVGGIVYAYGKPPYMHFAHCPKQTQGGQCANCSGYTIAMQDDKGADVELHRIKAHYCYGILIPSVPLNRIDFGAFSKQSILLDICYATEREIEALNNQMLRRSAYGLPYTKGNRSRKLQ